MFTSTIFVALSDGICSEISVHNVSQLQVAKQLVFMKSQDFLPCAFWYFLAEISLFKHLTLHKYTISCNAGSKLSQVYHVRSDGNSSFTDVWYIRITSHYSKVCKLEPNGGSRPKFNFSRLCLTFLRSSKIDQKPRAYLMVFIEIGAIAFLNQKVKTSTMLSVKPK